VVQLRRDGGAVQVSQPVLPGDGRDPAVQACREALRYVELRCGERGGDVVGAARGCSWGGAGM
jgi:hypothetical protein